MAKIAFLALATAIIGQANSQSFQYRFYAPSNCNHDNAPGQTFPRNDGRPLRGSRGDCHSAPTGVNWQRVEVDNPPGAVITFCNVNCQGSGSTLQNGGHCFTPFPGCAIGSFKIA